MQEVADATGALPATLEAGTLAFEMARAHRDYVEFFRGQYEPHEALQKAQDAHPDYFLRIVKCPPQGLTWCDLNHLAETDPALALKRWAEIKEAARDELQSGHRAAVAVDAARHSPWSRAQFLAVRDELASEWEPRNGIERVLIDTLAQAHVSYQFWLQMLTYRATVECRVEHEPSTRTRAWKPEGITEAAAVELAGNMVDRFNRLLVRTLRALRDLRRYAPAVIVQNAAQVNVAGQQVNVSKRD